MSAHSSQTPGRWATQKEAAQALGISTEAVRMRVRRGSLDSSKDGSGRVVVWVVLDHTETSQETAQQPTGELVEQLRSEVAYLRDQLEQANIRDRENRRLLAAALERMPELESGEQSEETARSSAEGFARGDVPQEPQQGTQRRSLWRRIFGG